MPVRLGNRTYRRMKCLFIFTIHYSFKELWVFRIFVEGLVRLGNREEIRRNPQKYPSKNPYQYAEIPKQINPKQINPTGPKRFLKTSTIPRKIRFGWNAGRIWVCTPQNRIYRIWDRGGYFFVN